jgi:hypothetical protein
MTIAAAIIATLDAYLASGGTLWLVNQQTDTATTKSKTTSNK